MGIGGVTIGVGEEFRIGVFGVRRTGCCGGDTRGLGLGGKGISLARSRVCGRGCEGPCLSNSPWLPFIVFRRNLASSQFLLSSVMLTNEGVPINASDKTG